MKFVVSSSDLLNHLQSINKVISPKNTLPILDNFLFRLEEKELEITASDLETTMITSMTLENAKDSGSIAIPAKLLTDILKEFPEQPLTFDINLKTKVVVINSENGQFTLVGQNGEDFPELPVVRDANKSELRLSSETLLKGISKTLFATSEDELRPIMHGILFEIHTDGLVLVATDAQKLVRYRRNDVKSKKEASFVLPKKPANLLKGILTKEKVDVVITFDNKNAVFSLSGYTVICRLTEGQFPSYNAVIPTENPNKLTVDRLEMHNTIRRVAVFSNQASNLIKLEIGSSQLTVSAQDIDFSISAYDRIKVVYDGEAMVIGFKSTFLIELLANLSSSEVLIEMSDPSRAALLRPIDKEDEEEDVLMLLMPIQINV